MTPVARFWRAVPWHVAGVTAVLALVAWWSPPPSPTDQLMMERVGQGVIVPGCADLNCFRILVPATVERFSGPSLPRWRVYAVVMNAAAAVAAGRLALALGVAPRAVALTIWLAALGAGSFSTVHHPYNADPFVLFLAPVTTWLLIDGRGLAAGALATVGIFAKEFAAAPLYIAAGAAAIRRDWLAFRGHVLLALAVTAIWLGLQIGLMAAFNYSYNANPSSQPLAGGYLRMWLTQVGPAEGAFALFGAFGALYLLMPVGWTLASPALRQLSLGAIPALLAFIYVATPERALWNFYFLVIPLAAIVLASLPAAPAWAFVACYALANCRIGAQISDVPPSRYALAAALAIAVAAIVRALRPRGETMNPRLAAV